MSLLTELLENSSKKELIALLSEKRQKTGDTTRKHVTFILKVCNTLSINKPLLPIAINMNLLHFELPVGPLKNTSYM